jgi:hypothetical protein
MTQTKLAAEDLNVPYDPTTCDVVINFSQDIDAVIEKHEGRISLNSMYFYFSVLLHRMMVEINRQTDANRQHMLDRLIAESEQHVKQ